MIVVDSNILAFYVIEGKRTADAHMLREIDAEWLVPTFWCVEFQSILWKYVRFGGMSQEQAMELFDQAMTMFSVNEVAPHPDIVLRDALKWGITAYDAQFVSLARQFGVRCITEDVPLQSACPAIAVSLRDFIKQNMTGGQVRETRATYGVRRKKRR